LEADIRKHIRIEHQLKLHIESTEDRIEELERDLEIGSQDADKRRNRLKSDQTESDMKGINDSSKAKFKE
tara:strand:+ start:81 stop:290 length:210 start_codon:yes stop_codon:yes gene_type:complete